MAIRLTVSVNGSPSADLSTGWRRLRITVSLADVEDTAELTLSRIAGRIQLPPRSATLSFVADGAHLGRFEVAHVAGDTRAGTLTIHCGSVNAESNLRQPRDRSWPGGPFRGIIETIAADAGLVPAVEPAMGRRILAPRVQVGESDLQFARRTVRNLGGRLLIQEGRLIATTGDLVQVSPLPPLRVDLRADGSWAAWRRTWRSRLGTVRARYLADDGVTVETVEAGDADYPTVRSLPTTFPSRDAAAAAAAAWLAHSDTSQDFLDINGPFAPAAQVLQPIKIVGGADRLPGGFGGLVVHQVKHDLGAEAATTTVTVAPQTSRG